MRSVDAHVHLWRRDDGEDFWMRDEIPALDRDRRAAVAGLSFMTVIAVVFIAVQTGVGCMIFSARPFGQTKQVFLGIIVLGCMGFAASWLLRKRLSRIA